MPRGLDRQGLAPAGRDANVEIARLGGSAVDRSSLAPEVAADHPHPRAVVVNDLRDLLGRDILVARIGHLERGGKIGPELEAVHAPARVALRHFLVEYPAARGHPLHVASAERALVAEAVAVIHG